MCSAFVSLLLYEFHVSANSAGKSEPEDAAFRRKEMLMLCIVALEALQQAVH